MIVTEEFRIVLIFEEGDWDVGVVCLVDRENDGQEVVDEGVQLVLD